MNPRLQQYREEQAKRQAECTHPEDALSAYIQHVNRDGHHVCVVIECKACGAHIGGSDIFPVSKKVTPRE